MLVMEVVGLMNLPWMLLLSIIIFLEKTWNQGACFSFFVGFGLLIFAALALAEPVLLGDFICSFMSKRARQKQTCTLKTM